MSLSTRGKWLFPILFITLGILPAMLWLNGCASHEITVTSPQNLFAQAEKAYQEKSFSRANELFQLLQNEYPDTEYAKLALLRTADISYRKHNLIEAAQTYNDFINFNEDHPKAPYAYYQSGMCHYMEISTLDRDLAPLKKALQTFAEGLKKYPDSPPYTEKLIQRINDCKRRFAKREFYIGFFYYKQKKFHAAAKRFEYLLQHYPGFIDDKVLYYLGLAYLNQGDIDKGHKALLLLSGGFPHSPFTAKARPWLDKNRGPGITLKFMARDYFFTHEEDIHDRYLTSEFAPESYSPRFFELFGQSHNKPLKAETVTFESLYRPTAAAGKKITPESATPTPPAAANGNSRPAPNGSQKATPSKPGAGPATRHQARLGRQDEPLEIISDWTEADRQKGTISFGGKVIAKQRDMVLYADKVVNYFDMQSRKLIRAIAVGNVKLNQADKFVTCEKAELIQAQRKVILTGNPVMWQGENRVTGEKIIIYLNESQAEVFGGKKKKAKVKITPEN